MGNAILYGNGTPANSFFKVICGSKPLTAKENTLWVDTVIPITNYQFTDTEPVSGVNGTALAEGDTWINEGSNCQIWTNTMIYQYQNNTWVYTDGEIFINGEWHTLINPQNQNQWLWKKYATAATVPKPSNFENLTPSVSEYLNDSAISMSINKGDNYSAYAITYLLFAQDTTISATFGTDDGGTLTINDTLIHTNSGYTTANVTLNFAKGWNKVEVCYTEGTGGDGWVFNPRFYNHASVLAMYASIH